MDYLVVGTLPQLTLPVNTRAQHSCSFRLLLKSSKGSRQPWVALESAVAALQTSNAVVAALETSNGKGPHEPSTRTRRTLERETYKGPRGSSKRRSATPSKRQDTYMDFTAVETHLANSAEAQ